MLKKIVPILAIAILAGCAMFSANVASPRQQISLDGPGWRVWLDEKAAWKDDTLYAPGEVPALDKLPVNVPTGGWTALTDSAGLPCSVPASVEEYFAKGINTWRYHGVSWFWRTVHIPADCKGKVIRLDIRQARFRAEIFVNEKLVHYDLCPETPITMDLSPHVNFGKKNTLAIRLTNPGGNRGWEDNLFPVTWGGSPLPPSHDFTGLDGVSLTALAPVLVGNVFVKNLQPAEARSIEARVTLKNTTQTPVRRTLSVRIRGTQAAVSREVECPPGETTAVFPFTVPEAKLWSPETPALYTCDVSLGKEDALSQHFGFRVFEVKDGTSGGGNFYLNGKRFRHHSAIAWNYYSLTGFYPTEEMAKKSVSAAKAIGQNGINHHRGIGAPIMNRLADELGVALLSEPGGLHSGGGEADLPDGCLGAKIMAEKVRRMVLRDRNHPSILIYNLSNEDNGVRELRKQAMRDIVALDGTTFIVNTSGDMLRNAGVGRAFAQKLPHPGLVPNIHPYETEMRGDHHDPHNNPNYGARHNEGAFFDRDIRAAAPKGTYYLGEMLAPTGPINWVKSFESRKLLAPGSTGYDLNVYETNHDKLVKAFADWRLDRFGTRAIKTPGDISVQAGRGMMYRQARDAQAAMSNNDIDGFALNGWTSGPQSEGTDSDWDSAILDEDRNLKGPAEDFLFWTKPAQVALVRANGKYFHPGQTAEFEGWVINEGKLSEGDATFVFSATDGAGRDIGFRHEIPLKIAGGDCFSQPLGRLKLPLPQTLHAGHVTLRASLRQGAKEVACGAEQILLQNRSSWKADLTRIPVAVETWPGAETALKEAGVDCASADSAAVICAGAPTANAVDLLARAKAGKTLILRFDAAWANILLDQDILSEPVTQWGGLQTGEWRGNGWGYLGHFIGDQALPAKDILGTNAWEVPADPVGFYPFASTHPLSAYGLHVARAETWLAIKSAQVKAENIVGTADAGLYSVCGYELPDFALKVPNGDCQVTLRFCEIFHASAGKRVFDIKAQGVTVAQKFDILAKAGGRFNPYDLRFASKVVNGKLHLAFPAIADTPCLSGIVIEGTDASGKPWCRKICLGQNAWNDYAAPKADETTAASLTVILGTIDYGKGKIILAPSYPVDANQAFNDLLFFNLIIKAGKKDW